jgi:glutaminyl-tRNA synthetase
MYERAILLIKKGLAYVCHLTPDEMREYRGTLTEVGKDSPYRTRSIDENLALFEQMRNGEFKEGECVLRAKIDMSSPNINLRDPIIYRIVFANHHNTGDKWCIYPMYDYAHPLEDAIEGITHSLCTIEFENHRPLYDWFVENCEMPKVPRQIEFGKLTPSHTILSKRNLNTLVNNGVVTGWDDARMPSLAGLRRRGVTPTAIRNFVLETGLSKIDSTSEIEFLNYFVRQDLSVSSPGIMAVLDPVKVIITNLPDGHVEYVEGANHTKNEDLGTRQIAFTKEIYIERDDIIEEKPNKKWKRWAKGIEVRLRHAYFVKCNEIFYDEAGNITEIHATYDENTKSGSGFNERKPNGTIHWVSATESSKTTFRIINNLITSESADKEDFMKTFNPNSLEIKNGYTEKAVRDYEVGQTFQFIRQGYFVIDQDTTSEEVVVNRTVSLKSSFRPQ